jgi:hypothetical protein
VASALVSLADPDRLGDCTGDATDDPQPTKGEGAPFLDGTGDPIDLGVVDADATDSCEALRACVAGMNLLRALNESLNEPAELLAVSDPNPVPPTVGEIGEMLLLLLLSNCPMVYKGDPSLPPVGFGILCGWLLVSVELLASLIAEIQLLVSRWLASWPLDGGERTVPPPTTASKNFIGVRTADLRGALLGIGPPRKLAGVVLYCGGAAFRERMS